MFQKQYIVNVNVKVRQIQNKGRWNIVHGWLILEAVHSKRFPTKNPNEKWSRQAPDVSIKIKINFSRINKFNTIAKKRSNNS